MIALKFNKLDIQSWERGEMFYYYTKVAPTGFLLTVELDVTIMKNVLKANNIKFFPAYIWLVTTIFNKQNEFKVAIKDELLGYYDTLTPMYPHFHESSKTISLMWTKYSNIFKCFYKEYLSNKDEYKDNLGILSQPHSTLPPNVYMISCIPWINFKHFSVHSYENINYYFPSIESGKVTVKESRLIIPLSITFHHATTDGWHINEFLKELQDNMDNPEKWIFSNEN